ncbi:MAG: hypothetical protein AUK44_09760 [Porphyromonadaceae bacterium CG2_30_38_12]|nr:MAG: hypothetical protein AUK44_09760 [Porphyromonadaceae bacterium CG2_30_38_12]
MFANDELLNQIKVDDKTLSENILNILNNRRKHGLQDIGTPDFYPRTLSVSEAFRNEFKGGFDVVIGNPPYVNAKGENFMVGNYPDKTVFPKSHEAWKDLRNWDKFDYVSSEAIVLIKEYAEVHGFVPIF